MRPSPQVLAQLLLLSPLLGAILVWLPKWWPYVRPPRGRLPEERASRFQDYATIGTSLVSLGLIVVIASISREALRFHVWIVGFYVDALSIYFVLLVNFVALVASFYVGPCLARRAGKGALDRTLFYSLFNLFHFTMVLVPMVSNLVVLWIGIELTTVTSTVLVAFERRRQDIEAAWKYIITTSTGIIFALLGTLFLASAIPLGAHPHPSMNWPDLVQVGDLDKDLIRLSFLFVLVGYGTKAGLAPMHTWLPDGHGEAPYPVSALLSGVLLKSALYAILRFYTITNHALDDDRLFTSHLLLGAGLLSLVVATPFILKRNPFKRVLAYHSLEHMGIITFGIGIGGPIALFGALLHVLNHGITKSLMFLAYGNVQDNYPSSGEAEPIGLASRPEDPQRGVLQAMPWTGFLLALGGLALVGSPPFNIFLSEFVILWGAVGKVLAQPTLWLTASIVIFVLSVTLIFGGLVRHLGRILVGSPPDRFEKETLRQVAPLLALLVVVVLFGMIVPAFGPLDMRRLLDDSVVIVCGGGGCP